MLNIVIFEYLYELWTTLWNFFEEIWPINVEVTNILVKDILSI